MKLTRPPPSRQDLAGDGICQGHGGEPHADQDRRPDESVNVSRSRRDARPDEGDGAGPDKQRFPRLECVGRRGDDGPQDALDHRQHDYDPGLRPGVVQVRSNVGQLGRKNSVKSGVPAISTSTSN